MLGIAHTLVEEGLARPGLSRRATASASTWFRPYLMGETDGQPKSADWAAPVCALDAEAIREPRAPHGRKAGP